MYFSYILTIGLLIALTEAQDVFNRPSSHKHYRGYAKTNQAQNSNVPRAPSFHSGAAGSWQWTTHPTSVNGYWMWVSTGHTHEHSGDRETNNKKSSESASHEKSKQNKKPASGSWQWQPNPNGKGGIWKSTEDRKDGREQTRKSKEGKSREKSSEKRKVICAIAQLGQDCGRFCDCNKGLDCINGKCVYDNDRKRGGEWWKGGGGECLAQLGDKCGRNCDCNRGLDCSRGYCIEDNERNTGGRVGRGGRWW